MKKNEILNAALEEFGNFNYELASINSIIKNSNTSKGTFYYYFKSKEDLYIELLKHVGMQKTNFLIENFEGSNESTNKPSIFAILKDQVQLSMQFALKYPKYAMFSSKVATETNCAIKEKIKIIVGNTSNEFFSSMIKTSIANKEVRDDFPENFTSQLLQFMITNFNEFLLYLGVEIAPDNASQIMRYLGFYINFLENGLKSNDNK